MAVKERLEDGLYIILLAIIGLLLYWTSRAVSYVGELYTDIRNDYDEFVHNAHNSEYFQVAKDVIFGSFVTFATTTALFYLPTSFAAILGIGIVVEVAFPAFTQLIMDLRNLIPETIENLGVEFIDRQYIEDEVNKVIEEQRKAAQLYISLRGENAANWRYEDIARSFTNERVEEYYVKLAQEKALERLHFLTSVYGCPRSSDNYFYRSFPWLTFCNTKSGQILPAPIANYTETTVTLSDLQVDPNLLITNKRIYLAEI